MGTVTDRVVEAGTVISLNKMLEHADMDAVISANAVTVQVVPPTPDPPARVLIMVPPTPDPAVAVVVALVVEVAKVVAVVLAVVVVVFAVVATAVGVTKHVHCSEIVKEEPEQAELMAEGIAEVAVILLAVYVAQKLVTSAVLAVKIDAQE